MASFNPIPDRYWVRHDNGKWSSYERSKNPDGRASEKYWKEREAEVDSDED